VLGADAGIVEAGGDRVRDGHLAIVALQQIAHRAVQHADRARRHGRAVLAGRDATTTGLHPDDPHAALGDERMEQPDAVAATTHATTTSGSLPSARRDCVFVSLPMTVWKSRTIIGYGCGPSAEPSR